MPSLLATDDVKHQVIEALAGVADIAALVGARVFPNQIPEDVLHVPCLVVTLIDGEGVKSLTGYTGAKRSTVQVDAFGDVSVQVVALSKAAQLRLMNHGDYLGALYVRATEIQGPFDLPSDVPSDESDRWRFRRAFRADIFHCEDTE